MKFWTLVGAKAFKMGGRGGGGNRGGGGGVRNRQGGGGVHGGGSQNNGNQRNVQDRESRENVKKFLTFYKRTKSICIDLYCPAFYKRKPYYDELADFVHDILCPSDVLRGDLEDVQLHPVKKNLFIKFRTVESRDAVAERLAGEGLEWPAFNTKVQGWAMDKPIVFVRVLGSSPESNMDDVKGVMSQYGEVLEVRKGKLSRKLPNVTNGTWTVRIIVGEGKVIPSFVFVNDDGEIWQLAHDTQETVCWQCGGQGHIGSRCREKAVSIAHDLLPAAPVDQVGVDAVPVQTWAHVVRGGAVPPAVDKDAAQKTADVVRQKKREEDEAAQGRIAADVQKEKEAADAKRIADEVEAANRLLDIPLVRKGGDDKIVEAAVLKPVGEAVETLPMAAKESIAADDAQENTLIQLAVESADKVIMSDDKLTTPSDIPNPAKVTKFDEGPVVPGSYDAQLGSSPAYFHKDPRVGSSQLPAFTSIALTRELEERMGEEVSQSAEFESLSDVGSSNANRPASASSSLEQNIS